MLSIIPLVSCTGNVDPSQESFSSTISSSSIYSSSSDHNDSLSESLDGYIIPGITEAYKLSVLKEKLQSFSDIKYPYFYLIDDTKLESYPLSEIKYTINLHTNLKTEVVFFHNVVINLNFDSSSSLVLSVIPTVNIDYEPVLKEIDANRYDVTIGNNRVASITTTNVSKETLEDIINNACSLVEIY